MLLQAALALALAASPALAAAASGKPKFKPNHYEKTLYADSTYISLPKGAQPDPYCTAFVDACFNVTNKYTANPKSGYANGYICGQVSKGPAGPFEKNMVSASCSVSDIVIGVTVDFTALAVKKTKGAKQIFPVKNPSYKLPKRKGYDNDLRLVTYPIEKKYRASFCKVFPKDCDDACKGYYEDREAPKVVTGRSKCSFNKKTSKATFYCWCDSKKPFKYASMDISLNVGTEDGAYGIYPISFPV